MYIVHAQRARTAAHCYSYQNTANCYALHYSQHDGQGKATTTTQTYRKEECNNGLCVKGKHNTV